MATASDVILAQFAASAYADAPSLLPTGFAPVAGDALGVAIDSPGESFANGVYRNQNAAALVASGTLEGQRTLVLAFRGSDDREDSINTLRGSNADYLDLVELITAVDALAVQGGYAQIAVTGHSLGGSLTQLYMTNHPQGGAVPILATTFGSPGAQITEGPDPRIVNFVIADDPAPFLGENRAAVGEQLRGNPALAAASIFTAADLLPGLTPGDALASLPTLTTDYENRGEAVLLPGRDGGTTPISSLEQALAADPAQHRVALYLGEVSELAGFTLISVSRGGAAAQELASAYSGPVGHLQWQFLGTAAAEVATGSAGNDFMNLLGSDDAAAGGAGDDVLDGGTGSNFLSGGAGRDVFFLDGRGGPTTPPTWSTIADWEAGEQLSLFGWRPGASRAIWAESDGVAGFQGATLHADLDGNGRIDASVTWAGVTRAALPAPIEQDGLLWFT
jgi:pimeloyl-ACP methyl ester carboxylesterase